MTGRELTMWRRKLDLTQDEASQALGCSRRAMTNWETRRQSIPRYIALACAAISANLEPVGKKALRRNAPVVQWQDIGL